MKNFNLKLLVFLIAAGINNSFVYGQAASLNADGTAPDANTMFDIKSNGNTSSYYGLKVKESGGSNLFVVRSDGNVGIGSSSPATKLDIAGNLLQSASSYHNFGTTVGSAGYGIRDNAGVMEYSSTPGTWLPIASTSSAAGWTKNGTKIYTTTSTDSVGIGTSSPTSQFHLNYNNGGGGAGGGMIIQNTATSGEIAALTLKCAASGPNYLSQIMYEPDGWAIPTIAQGLTFRVKTIGQDFAFQSGTASTDVKMWIEGTSGNVGIGPAISATPPNSKLTLDGELGLKEMTAPGLTASYGKLYVKSSDSKLYFKNSAGTEIDLTAAGGTGGWSASAGNVYLTTSSNNVGVGMSTPNEKLTVEGALSLDELSSAPTATSGYGKIYTKSSDNNLYYLDGLGVEVNLSSGASDFSNGGDAASATRKLGNTNAYDMRFVTNNADRISILSTGNVGIGTSSPTDFLHVQLSTPGTGGGLTIENIETNTNNPYATLKLLCPTLGSTYYSQIFYSPNSNNWTGSGITPGLNFRTRVTGQNFSFQSGTLASDVKMWIDGTSGNMGIGVAPSATAPGAKLEVNGGIMLNTSTSKPTCNAAARGTFWFTQGGAGVKDACEVCAKDAADSYGWRVLY